jgi:predicted alpha/beta-hydrolase family hydrolase
MKVKLLIASLLFVLAAGVEAKEVLATLSTRSGVEQKYLLNETPNAAASVILFAGGKGVLKLSKSIFGIGIDRKENSFLIRTRKDFARQGFTVAVVDAPSDRQGEGGMLGDFRTSRDHVADIDAVIADLRQRANAPVWLIGTGRGTESAAYVAIHSQQKPDGLVLISSTSVPNKKGVAVTELALDQITIPTFIVAHKQDGCTVTPASGTKEINAGLTNSPRVEVAFFDGGRERGNPCKSESYHGFLGIDGKVVERIAAFIKIQKGIVAERTPKPLGPTQREKELEAKVAAPQQQLSHVEDSRKQLDTAKLDLKSRSEDLNRDNAKAREAQLAEKEAQRLALEMSHRESMLASLDRKRYALVIGNAGYQKSPLRNPKNDAHDIAGALKKLRFDVDLQVNADRRQMEEAIDRFGERLRKDKKAVGLFYYAGHGVQADGKNYLVPLKSNIKYEKDLRYKAVELNYLLDTVAEARNAMNVVILDACRDNPFEYSLASRGLPGGGKQKGLAQSNRNITGTLIAYATAPGNVSLDGSGENGIYTKHLLRWLNTPNITIEKIFKETATAVARETRNQQVPWINSSLLGDDFYLQVKQ